jgi:hypothetical protein
MSDTVAPHALAVIPLMTRIVIVDAAYADSQWPVRAVFAFSPLLREHQQQTPCEVRYQAKYGDASAGRSRYAYGTAVRMGGR